MITTADAMEVMLVVQACHRRTAPRMDDEQVAVATATIWAELFNDWKLTLPHLIKAVKTRASYEAEAPEPAEIIKFARDIRREESQKSTDRSDYEALCDAKAGDDRSVLRTIVQKTGQKPLGRSLNEVDS